MRRLVGRRFRRRDGYFEGINITPFTDVLLVLLIIFLIAGSTLAPTGVAVDRMVATSTETEGLEDPGNRLTVQIDIEGEARFDYQERALTWDSLKALDSETLVTLSANRRTPSGAVVKSYDRLLRAGFTNIEWGPPWESSQGETN